MKSMITKQSIKTFFTRVLVYSFALVLTLTLYPIYQPVNAQVDSGSCDEAFYAKNDILFYNPCATSCGANPTTSAVKIDKLRGNNNGEKIFNFWLDAGMTSQQSAGITGSMQHEGGFSPFRQEEGNVGYRAYWPNGGWGIAQFTWDPGQRGNAKAYVSKEVGAELFDLYYKVEYGGPVTEANGFIPAGVPVDVNDKFLLAELNYLLDHIKGLIPNNVRVDGLKNDFKQTIPSGTSLYDYLKTIVQAPDAAHAWTYLYEWPGDRINTSNRRGESALAILDLYGTGISTTCGGSLVAGGMTLEQAKEFMKKYREGGEESRQHIGGAGQGCVGGPLANCVSFSVYFINKYTTLEGFTSGAPGNGNTVATNAVARNPGIQSGHSPRPYAIFSRTTGEFGHTGIILGVDVASGDVIVGEAVCGMSNDWTDARVYKISQMEADNYIYAYTDGKLKGGIE
ncbi:MAG: phage tail tip lysozyme [Candidatus Saccharimonadota bacterium]